MLRLQVRLELRMPFQERGLHTLEKFISSCGDAFGSINRIKIENRAGHMSLMRVARFIRRRTEFAVLRKIARWFRAPALAEPEPHCHIGIGYLSKGPIAPRAVGSPIGGI